MSKLPRTCRANFSSLLTDGQKIVMSGLIETTRKKEEASYQQREIVLLKIITVRRSLTAGRPRDAEWSMGRNGPELTAVQANSLPPLAIRSQEMPRTRLSERTPVLLVTE
ncbi:hypothetical protein ElyMa_003706600 [Elysia marginata]|uniref:Single-stranded DNA-binding protein n=1 Tax=Elysia marginata TaxID=1093978 RepID=A0AAV4F319_9GAST|nr:hypothetical protein ElyMa_003706600 [Elysia marginata]